MRELAIGGLPALTLKNAREIAAEYRAMVARDIESIEQRKKKQRDAISRRKVLKDVAHDAFKSKQAE